MLLLAVDSATPVAGVALLNEEKLLKEEFSSYKKTHSETLMLMIDRVLRECDCRLKEIDAIAVSAGPGSFTGLRIGMAAAKGLCLAAGKPLLAVSTLDLLAHNVVGTDAMVCPLLDARKQEIYTCFYDVTGEFPRRLGAMTACSPEQLVQNALAVAGAEKKERVLLLGDGYYTYKEYLRESLGNKLLTAPPHLMLPRASALGSLALAKFQEGDFEDVFNLRPFYLRLSEAEYRLGKGEL